MVRGIAASEISPTLLIVCLKLLRLPQAILSLQDIARWPVHLKKDKWLSIDFFIDSGTLYVARRKKTEIKFSLHLCCPECEICPLEICLDDSVPTAWWNCGNPYQFFNMKWKGVSWNCTHNRLTGTLSPDWAWAHIVGVSGLRGVQEWKASFPKAAPTLV